MSGQTPITVVGNVTDDPDLRFTHDGTACCVITVAVNPRRFDRNTQQWVDGEPSFHRVTVWRQLGENVAESIKKGARVIVSGTLAQRHWETDAGEKRSAWGITADAVGAELTFATATVKRMSRTARGDVAPDDPWATASTTRPAPASEEPPF